MARVVVTATAQADLAALIESRNLPGSARDRVRAHLRPLRSFPLLGRELGDPWAPLRVLLGPWPWLLIVYGYDEAADLITIVTIADSRTSAAPQ